MEEFLTFNAAWPWPWIRPHGILSCITHQPLPTHQISFESETFRGRTDGQTLRMALLGRLLRGVYNSFPIYMVCVTHTKVFCLCLSVVSELHLVQLLSEGVCWQRLHRVKINWRDVIEIKQQHISTRAHRNNRKHSRHCNLAILKEHAGWRQKNFYWNWDCPETVPGNMYVKFEVCSFNRFGAISI